MDHRVIITGATGGLGKAFVYECASRGYDLILTATKQDRLEALAAEVVAKYPQVNIVSKSANLADESSRKAFFEFLTENKINFDMLINNAGYIFEMSFLGCCDEEILTAIRVNVEGTLDMIQKALKMRETDKKFYVLTVSSSAGFYSMAQMATYAATKAALTNFSISLREELKSKNTNVTVVCPGSMATTDAMKASIKSQGIGGRLSLVSVEKVAKLAVNGMLKNKAMVIPGFFNKILHFVSIVSPRTVQARVSGKRWRSCEAKRGEVR